MGRGKEEGGVSELIVVVQLLLLAFQLLLRRETHTRQFMTMLVFCLFILFSSFLLLSGLSSASGEIMQVMPVNVTALHLTLNKHA